MTGTRVRPLVSGLPIFRLDGGDRCVLYAAGHVAVVSPALADRWESSLRATGTAGQPLSPVWESLCACARQVELRWQEALDAPFRPVCLTVFLSNRCNCACSYCFTAPVGGSSGRSERDSTRIEEPVVRAAARLVAQNCARQEKPFDLVLHGGGEPALEWPLVQRLEMLTRNVAQEAGTVWRGYIATNGVLAPDRVRWLAEHFDRIGLSCDGPPDVQDRQRPQSDGRPTSAAVRQTAAVLAAHASRWGVRTTVTPQTVRRQAEIVRYLCRELRAPEIRLEPVFQVDSSSPGGFQPDEAGEFVAHYLAAEREAAALGCALTFSGVRLDEIHGPYCDILRNVLHLTPDGTATACFFASDGRDPAHRPLVVGGWDAVQELFILNEDRIRTLRRRVGAIPDGCRSCFNQYHCMRECPERCVARDGATSARRPRGFRCEVAQQLAEAWILGAAGVSSSEPSAAASSSSPARPMAAEPMIALLEDAPRCLDRSAILERGRALPLASRRRRRCLPLPIWAQRGFEDRGETAWARLRGDLLAEDAGGPLSLYVHVPLCDRRCPFCDCYSFVRDRRGRREEAFVSGLLNEIRSWASIRPLRRRPVTTVHFGGGTPNCLTPARLAAIVRELQAAFAVHQETEWALESTTSLLTPEHLAYLRALGFTRLHVGIQTLEDPIRRLLRRRETAAAALAGLDAALARNWIVSVDLIYGLPGQSLPGLVRTLEQLAASGVHGVSLYQLQTSPRNRAFLERQAAAARDPLFDYTLFQAADDWLQRQGYRKNHFTHYARPPDQNLYYRHAVRGEDLLALGPSADGVFGAYHYRHPEYDAYVAETSGVRPALEGGVAETREEAAVRPAQILLMAGEMTEHVMNGLHAGELLRRWIAESLVERAAEAGRFFLTGNGSWCVTEMLAELAEHASKRRGG